MKLSATATIAALLLAISGCGDDSRGAPATATPSSLPGHGPSFLDDYLATRKTPSPPQRLDTGGDWFGVAFCPSGPFPITATVSGERASLSLLPAIGDPNRSTPFYADHADREANVEYDTATQTLSISAPAPAESDPRQSRGLDANLLLAPDGSGHALLTLTETGGARPRSCTGGIAGRGDSAAALRTFAEHLATIRRDQRPVVQGACPPLWAQWLDSAVAKGADALMDNTFTAALGTGYLDASADDLLQTSAVLSGSCITTKDQREAIALTRAAALLRDYRIFGEQKRAAVADHVASAWAAWANTRLEAGAMASRSDAAAVRLVPHRFELAAHPALAGLAARIASAGNELQTADTTESFARRLEKARGDFRGLLTVVLQASARDDVDHAVLARGLDYYLAGAAASAAGTVSEPPDAAYLAGWARQQREGAGCLAQSTRTCGRAATAIESGLSDFAERFAREEDAAFASVMRTTSGLEQLSAAVTFERVFRDRYGALADYPAFAAGREARGEARQELQKSLGRELLAAAAAARTEPALRALASAHFLDNELLESPALRRQLDEHLQTTRPFDDLPGGDYMNALYNRDVERLRELDRRYLAGILPIMRFGLQQATLFGPLIDALADRRDGSTTSDLHGAMDRLTALYAVMGTYLLEYQNVYAQCLKPGARTFTIETRTDTVTRDGLGNEIRRQEGWTSRDSYRVNPEFAGQFQALFNAATGSAQSQFLDLLLNDAGIARLRAGTRELMRRYRCDDGTVRQLERGLLAYDATLRER